MRRSIFYPATKWRGFDVVNGFVDVVQGFSDAMSDITGQTGSLVSGFTAIPQTPASAGIALEPGAVWQLAEVDPVAQGSIPQNTTLMLLRGTAGYSQNLAIPVTALAAGQALYTLVCAQVANVDNVRANDPDGGLLAFWNAAAPINPLLGIGGNRQVLPTVRNAGVTLQVVTGVAAAVGSEAPPACPAGFVPIVLVHQVTGQTAYQAADISYPAASPRLAGLLNSHHGGVPGQAPKILLTGGAEVQGLLPASNYLDWTFNVQGITQSTSFQVPPSVEELDVELWGGGGAGGGTSGSNSVAAGGFGGGYARLVFKVTPGTVYPVTVAGLATPGQSGGNGAAGGTTSFGNLLSATGGSGGIGAAANVVASVAGSAGEGVGGQIVLPGAGGGSGGVLAGGSLQSGVGGGSGNGNGSGGSFSIAGGSQAASGQGGQTPGGAGSGGLAGGGGGIGAAGLVIVRWRSPT